MKPRDDSSRRVHSIAVDLALDAWIETVIQRLGRLGYRRATRSAIVREALGVLQQQLDGLSDGHLLRFFVDRDVQRALAPVQRLQDDNPKT